MREDARETENNSHKYKLSLPRANRYDNKVATRVCTLTSSALQSHAGVEPPQCDLSRPEPPSAQPASIFDGGMLCVFVRYATTDAWLSLLLRPLYATTKCI